MNKRTFEQAVLLLVHSVLRLAFTWLVRVGLILITELLTPFMDSSGHPAEFDGNPHPRVIDFLGVFIAVLTLTLPLYTISLYSPRYSSPASQVQSQILLGHRDVPPGLSP